MKRIRLLLITTLFVLMVTAVGDGVAASKPDTSTQEVTQRDFVRMLVSAFKWDTGLSEKPADNEYLAILGGRRSMQFEAEEYYSAKTDNATVMNYELYGPFSGNGWVSGIAVPTTVHFKLFIPLEGEYALNVVSKGDGQIWSAGGKKFKVSTGKRLREEVAGKVRLKAGEQELSVELPPEGAVDYFSLHAPQLAAIEPLEGWRLDAPLTLGAFSEIAGSLLSWEKTLPEDSEWKPLTVEIAKAASIPQGAQATTIDYLGRFHAEKWIRAGRSGARVVVPLIIADSAPYQLKVRFLGEAVDAELDGKKIERAGKPFLDWVDLGATRLKRGAHTLILRLPPNAGVDVLTLMKLKSSPQDYMKLVGIEGAPDDSISRSQAERLLTSLAERFEERQ